MTEKNGWLLFDVIEPREISVVMVGGRVRAGVAWRSVVTKNHEQMLSVVLSCCRSKTTVREKISDSRWVTAVPVVERTHARVHGVWVCTHHGEDPVTLPSPSWAFLWDLTEGFAYRGDAVGMPATWADLGIPVRRPIADAFRVFDMGEHNTTALAALARKSGGSIDRYTINEQRSGGDRLVHFVVHSTHGVDDSVIDSKAGVRFLRGLSVDVGTGSPTVQPPTLTLGDRVAEALTPQRQYRAISDPDSLNLLYWHGPPAPRIAWMADNTADTPILHPADMPTALATVSTLKAAGQGSAIDLVLRFLTLDGAYEPFEMSASLIDLDSGQSALLVVLTVE